jgi:cellulose synthase operon protein C
MPTLLPKKRSTRITVIVVALAVLLGGGYAGAKWIAWPYFKAWRENRANNVARELFEKGDYTNALVAARKTLEYNQMNVEAWKLAVEITEKQNSPEAVFWQMRLANVQPTLENKLKQIRLAVKHNAYAQAFDAVSKMGAEASDSAEFYELAALVCQRMGQTTKAKYYLMSLVKLRPDDKKARFELAQIRLLDGFAENKPAIRAEIRAIANDAPDLRNRALALLLADAIDAKSEAEALELADQVALIPDIAMPTQVMIAECYRLFAPKRFTAHIEKVKAAADTADEVVIVVNYLANHDLADETRKWIDKLPEALKATESVQVVYAYCLLKLDDMPALETFLRASKWTENEYARQTLLAYRYHKMGDMRAFNDAWKLAVIEIGNNPRKLQTLIAQVSVWNWPEQKFELLWKRFNMDPSDKAVRQQLAVWERSKNNTPNLNRLFNRITEFDPSDKDYKNNYTYTCLLLNLNLDRAHNDARELYEANPKNGFYTTTYALSLYKQGKHEEALRVFESMGAGVLAMPERTLIHSILLMANGRVDEGLEQSSHLKLAQFLPEERRLFGETAIYVERAKRDKASVARLTALSHTGAGTGADRKSWLNVLPAAFRKSSVQMELADSLYAADDFNGLENALKSEKWEENDFLRQALLAYAQRSQGKDGEARGMWRIAVSGAGNRPANLAVLEDMCERWGWPQERIEILNRIYTRDPLDTKVFNELVEHYSRGGQTSELARVFGLRVEADNADADAKTRFAYYSLLTNSNLSRAHVLARETYDAAPSDIFRTKVYAFSLLKQARAADGWRLLEKLPEQAETGTAQLSLLKAAIALQQDDAGRAKLLLNGFDAKTALPEESALAESLAKTIAQKNA